MTLKVLNVFIDDMITGVMDNQTSDPEEAAENLVNEYIDFCETGQASFGTPISSITASARQTLKNAIISISGNFNQTRLQFQTSFNAAFNAFWLTPGNIIFTVPTTNVNPGVIPVPMNFLNAVITSSKSVAASYIAGQLNAYTRTVNVFDPAPLVGTII